MIISETKIRSLVILLLALALGFLASTTIPHARLQTAVAYLYGHTPCPPENLCVHFLDVGQGDAIFIESPSGTEVLVDGGEGNAVLRELSTHMGFFDRSIDMVVATHPDSDHIGGLIDVFDRFTIDTVLRNKNSGEGPTYRAFQQKVASEGPHIRYARAGQTFALGGGATLEVLFPDRDVHEVADNVSSIVLQLDYGATTFLLMADAPKAIETYLTERYGTALKSDVLKVGHHGSDTSTGELFVEAVDPSFAVISVGADNSYGHPAEATVDTLRAHHIQIESTAKEGTITFSTDGNTLVLQ